MDKTYKIGGMSLTDMNDVTLAYNLGSLTEVELKTVPQEFIRRWDNWRRKQSNNAQYWTRSTHC